MSKQRTSVKALTGALAVGTALAMVPALPTMARQRTRVTHNCHDTKVKPRRILFACGDGNYYVKQLNWKYWHQRRAKARGVFHFNDCNPSCAGGTFHRRAGKLVLRRKMWCEDTHETVFRRAKIVYDRPWQGEDTAALRLLCPF